MKLPTYHAQNTVNEHLERKTRCETAQLHSTNLLSTVSVCKASEGLKIYGTRQLACESSGSDHGAGEIFGLPGCCSV
jgi:hypothetical protein